MCKVSGRSLLEHAKQVDQSFARIFTKTFVILHNIHSELIKNGIVLNQHTHRLQSLSQSPFVD